MGPTCYSSFPSIWMLLRSHTHKCLALLLGGSVVAFQGLTRCSVNTAATLSAANRWGRRMMEKQRWSILVNESMDMATTINCTSCGLCISKVSVRSLKKMKINNLLRRDIEIFSGLFWGHLAT